MDVSDLYSAADSAVGQGSVTRVDSRAGINAYVLATRIQVAAYWIAKVLDILALFSAGVLLLFLVVTVFLEVVLRYFFATTLLWSVEGTGFALVWFGLIAAVVSARKSNHFAFRWLVAKLPEGPAYILRQLINVGIVAFLVLVVETSINYLTDVSSQMAATLPFNLVLPYLGVTIGASSLCLVYVLEVVDAVCSIKTHVRLSEREKNEAAGLAMLKSQSVEPSDKEQG